MIKKDATQETSECVQSKTQEIVPDPNQSISNHPPAQKNTRIFNELRRRMQTPALPAAKALHRPQFRHFIE